jgi:hypothetical protein
MVCAFTFAIVLEWDSALLCANRACKCKSAKNLHCKRVRAMHSGLLS